MRAQYKGVPEGAAAVIPRLVCRNVEAQIEFCCEALGAVEALRRPGPDGRAAHAMLKFGRAMLMLEAEWPTLPSRAPNTDGSSPVVIYLYVEDVDATVERALKRGGKLVVPVETPCGQNTPTYWNQGRWPCGQRIKRLGSRTQASRRVGRDSEWSCFLGLSGTSGLRKEEKVALTVVVPFKMMMIDVFGQRQS